MRSSTKMKVCVYLFLISLLFLLGGCATPKSIKHKTSLSLTKRIYSLKEGRIISKARLIEVLSAYPVIFIGDLHNNEKMHQFTAELIATLGKEYTLHLANEWFTPMDNETLAQFVNKKLNEKEFLNVINWKKNIGYQYKSFKPIYQNLKEVEGKMYGINLSRDERKKISLIKIDDMDAKEKLFYKNIDLNTSIHKQFISSFLSDCHAPLKNEEKQECLERMYRVQVAWDEKMGKESAILAKKVIQGKKDKLIVFVGAMHLEFGLGVNMRFARNSTLPYVTVLPGFEKNIELGKADFIYYIKDAPSL